MHFLASSMKDSSCNDDFNEGDDEGEEGLDEREPEKAICPEN